uniref:Arsenite-resistance protein 2 n=1 Tax=Anolis carolinensis TaxID=28377 RepID=A0A803TAB4_ANOCA
MDCVCLAFREWDRGRERRSRGEYRDYDRNRRERFSPPRHELSPPQKRMRRDWDEHTADPYHSGYEMPYTGVSTGPTYGPPQPWAHPEMHVTQHHILPIQARLGNIAEVDLGIAPPVMKSFKEFLLSLDDSIDETEAVKRYNDYKLDFRRQQMQEFFLAHKDEEWFRSKYHPDEAGRRKQEAHSGLQNRLSVFLYLMDNGWFEGLQLDIDKAPAIIKVLDAAVIKMEGGSENDLKILEQEEEEERQEKAELAKKEENRLLELERKASEKDDGKKEEAKKASDEEAAEDKAKNASEEEEEEKRTEKKEEPDKEAPKKSSHKRKRKRSGDDSYDEGSVSESDSESESGRPEEDDKEEEKPKEEKAAGAAAKEGEESPKAKEKDGEPKPRPLHKTCSLFVRNIAPNISQAEIVALCKRYPGFMRVALSDPQPERRFFRRGWITFDRSVNIKEICWNLQNIRLRECELSPGVNRDLTRRVRNVNGITQHKQILRNDIKLAAKLIHTMDDRTQLWGAGEARPASEVSSLPSQNPILKNITDYLIEEVSAEEEELLGKSGETSEEPPKEGNPAEITVERDEKLVKVLDKLLLYLRIVHSVDYYNNSEYLNEDEMPNRCGIIHVRGPIPPNRVTHREVAEWQKTFEDKLTPLFSVRESLSEEEAQKMGKKDPEQEVEKFVTANTQELGKDKWLCPLSGKKFKGPEFVRKHIFNKHAEKIEEVKKEVSFFNNFLTDAKRPALPELKMNQPPIPGQGGPPYPPTPYAAGRGNYDTFRGQGGYLNKPRNRMVRGDPRAIVEYRDLDAPEDVDFF